MKAQRILFKIFQPMRWLVYAPQRAYEVARLQNEYWMARSDDWHKNYPTLQKADKQIFEVRKKYAFLISGKVLTEENK